MRLINSIIERVMEDSDTKERINVYDFIKFYSMYDFSNAFLEVQNKISFDEERDNYRRNLMKTYYYDCFIKATKKNKDKNKIISNMWELRKKSFSLLQRFKNNDIFVINKVLKDKTGESDEIMKIKNFSSNVLMVDADDY